MDGGSTERAALVTLVAGYASSASAHHLARGPPHIARRICKSFSPPTTSRHSDYCQLYQNALTLLDTSSLERVRGFYHRADACRKFLSPRLPHLRLLCHSHRGLLSGGCLIGRLLPRVLLSEQRGVSADEIHFATTESGKPYFARSISFLSCLR